MDRGAAEIRVSSRLDADPAAVWEPVTTPAGINDEMRPIMRMSVPEGVDRHRRLQRRFGGSPC